MGHVISKEGITFTKEKREKVLDYPLPVTHKNMKSFLGLVNYFRDHVGDMTETVKQLQVLCEGYVRNKKITYTPDQEKAFYDARDKIGNCPALFFVDERAVWVMTDASDFGIGAYIYQLIDGHERPIIFISKSLQGAQKNWSVIEKEAYAIFYTLTHYEHLLRDVKFMLLTDHKNLTYINCESSPKVKRWKLALSHYDFDIQHVEGVKNSIADAFSRLCLNESKSAELQLSVMDRSKEVAIPKERDSYWNQYTIQSMEMLG